MENYPGKTEYLSALEARGALPKGFRSSATTIDFLPAEMPGAKRMPMNLTLLCLDEPTDAFAGVFTRNAYPGAPVIIGKSRMRGEFLRGILVNNKVANVSTPTGVEDAESIVAELAGIAGGSPELYVPASTGVIGWRLPVEDIKTAQKHLVDTLDSRSVVGAAEAIMTTDAYPKVRSAGVGDGRIVAIAKGAGMIEPNMATMLVFILTDIAMSKAALHAALTRTVSESFNRISVDGDQSTSDMAIIMSSKQAGSVPESDFQVALNSVCQPLAEDIVRNGEGTAHVMKVRISGSLSDSDALGLGKAVINSPLVKTAIFGNDPNVGRILMALGDHAGNSNVQVYQDKTSIDICGHRVYTDGAFELTPDKESAVSVALQGCMLDSTSEGYPSHDRCVEIDVIVGDGSGTATVIGSDLSYGYVKENADYRT